MKIASTTTMAKLLNRVAKEMSKDSGMHFRYITITPEAYRRYVDMDLWDAEDYGDYNADTGKLRVIEVEYPSEFYACNNYLTSKELNKIFKNNRDGIENADDFAKVVVEAIEI